MKRKRKNYQRYFSGRHFPEMPFYITMFSAWVGEGGGGGIPILDYTGMLRRKMLGISIAEM